jgi:hypothetical protein
MSESGDTSARDALVGPLSPQLAVHKQVVISCLMRPLFVVMLEPLGHQVVEMPLAENHKVIETLLLDRLNKPLHVGVRVGRKARRHGDLVPRLAPGRK